jgi:hypothetical protein
VIICNISFFYKFFLKWNCGENEVKKSGEFRFEYFFGYKIFLNGTKWKVKLNKHVRKIFGFLKMTKWIQNLNKFINILFTIPSLQIMTPFSLESNNVLSVTIKSTLTSLHTQMPYTNAMICLYLTSRMSQWTFQTFFVKAFQPTFYLSCRQSNADYRSNSCKKFSLFAISE